MNDITAFEPLSRRALLKFLILSSSAAIFPTFYTACSRETPAYFPQSVASGDPHSDSVILWTRIEDEMIKDKDYLVELEVASDENFSKIIYQESLVAYSVLDHTIRIKIDQLEPYTYYYYKFRYQGVDSNVGRTKTAPPPDMDANIKFAFVSGQDYVGRYYNTYAHMLQFDTMDFIVHLGDYIYETTGDPSFQNITKERSIQFRDVEGAIKFGSPEKVYYAAKSLDNYRQLYQVYRSDVALQMIHERFPMIAIWDDHEYSNDAYGDHSNYFGGRVDEENKQRKQNAQRAYWEYMPTEIGLEIENQFTPSNMLVAVPEGMPTLYRDFDFGSNVHLTLTDYRTFRPDHVIPEDAFIGQVFADKEQLIDFYEKKFPSKGYLEYQKNLEIFTPYVNVDKSPYFEYRGILVFVLAEMYRKEGIGFVYASELASSHIKGKMSAFVVNEMLKAYNGSTLDYEGLERGLSYLDLGKINLFSVDGIGCRGMVVKDVFDIYSALKGKQNVYGDKQDKWIKKQYESSESRWEIFANSVSMTPMVVNLEPFEILPDIFRKTYYLDLDQFDGFPAKKREIIQMLREKNSVIISGDIHASFITDHHGVTEFTGTSISSATFNESLRRIIANNVYIKKIDGVKEIINTIDLDTFLLSENRKLVKDKHDYPVIKKIDTKNNGYTVLEVSSDEITATLYKVQPDKSDKNRYKDKKLNDLFRKEQYLVRRDQ